MHTWRIAILTLLVLTVGTVTTFAAVSGAKDSPATARPVDGPSTGPSGQTGELTYLDDTGSDYAGGADEFGPYRLVPPGTKQIVREYPQDTEAREFSESHSRSDLPSSRLLVAPDDDWTESAFRALLRNGRVVEVSALWEGSGGISVSLLLMEVPDWALPLDTYLTFPDSLTTLAPAMIAGHYAILDGPNEDRQQGVPPPPPGGTVRIYFGGGELIVQSDVLPVAEVAELAADIVARIPEE